MDDLTDIHEARSVSVYLDEQIEPLASYRPPAIFQLDTKTLEDGDHLLRIRAVDAVGNVGCRKIPFIVSNGPGITVTGLRAGSSVNGTIDIKINAFSGEEPFDPGRAESHGPVPVWTWVMCAMVAAWALWYGLEFFATPSQFASTPTYAANPSLAAANEPASGPSVQRAPAFTGKGAAGGFDYDATGVTAYTANCASCHGAAGAGVPNTFPPLVADSVVTASDPSEHVRAVLRGLHGKKIGSTAYGVAMPAFAHLSDQDIAAIIDHERTSWGNHSPIITPNDVKKER